MIRIETQIHAYRQGHQLLSASTRLSKEDQAVIDRLSDMAGPLRPGEVFDPYLSAYPLPSGKWYVLARTCQDLDVSRAGCVRTFSLLIPRAVWSSASGLRDFMELINPKAIPDNAKPIVIRTLRISPLPMVRDFQGSELMEALFLEEGGPVVVFDVAEAELVTVRLLTSLWPSIRMEFCVSTFALSPRRIEGRDFNLVFAPGDARPRFADWPGRRIDGLAAKGPRHRWTNSIVDRVFREDCPRLLIDSKRNLVGLDRGSDASVLRISLMWDDLLDRVEEAPLAALGLLDIVSSGVVNDIEAIRTLEPVLAKAADRAVVYLTTSEAWDFLAAMVRKLHRMQVKIDGRAVGTASRVLASKDPGGVISVLEQSNSNGEFDDLLPYLARGVADSVKACSERALLGARPETLGRLVCTGQFFAEMVVSTRSLVGRLGDVLRELSGTLFDDVRGAVLPLLNENAQFAAILPLISSLDDESLVEKVRQLGDVNKFEATMFMEPLVSRAREVGAIARLRETLLAFPVTDNRNSFLRFSLTGSVEDVVWLLEQEHLDPITTGHFLVAILRESNAEQFGAIIGNRAIAPTVLENVPLDASDVLKRALLTTSLPLADHMHNTLRLLPISHGQDGVELASMALERCLESPFGDDEVNTIGILLRVVGNDLDGPRVFHRGLKRRVATGIVNRNIVAFERAPDNARIRILQCIDDLARALERRYTVDLDDAGARAFAQLVLDASDVDSKAVLRASEKVLPILLRAGDKPVSGVIAAMFPFIYRELSKEELSPSLFHLMLFVDWDRCKTARRKLVNAFLSSDVWSPSDLALTACRCMDVDRILKRTAKSDGGDAYIRRLEGDLEYLPIDCRGLAVDSIARIRLESSDLC